LEVSLELTSSLPAPNVDVTHLYGVGVPTGLQYTWASDDKFEAVPKSVNGPGDGTVNLVSLKSVAKWGAEQAATGFSFEEMTFPGQSHTGVLSYQPYINALLDALGLNASSSGAGGPLLQLSGSDAASLDAIRDGGGTAGVERV
jgi:hypothetical protein